MVSGELSDEPGDVASRGRHAWNMVRVDGAWYHVDVTGDLGMSHDKRAPRLDYLGLSDDEISACHTWDCALLPTCNSSLGCYRRQGLYVSSWEELGVLLCRTLAGANSCAFELDGRLAAGERDVMDRALDIAVRSAPLANGVRRNACISGNVERNIYEVRLTQAA